MSFSSPSSCSSSRWGSISSSSTKNRRFPPGCKIRNLDELKHRMIGVHLRGARSELPQQGLRVDRRQRHPLSRRGHRRSCWRLWCSCSKRSTVRYRKRSTPAGGTGDGEVRAALGIRIDLASRSSEPLVCQIKEQKIHMPLQGEYAPSTSDWARKQAEAFEASNGESGNDMRGMSIIVVTSVGAKTGKLRKTPLMRVEHEGEYAAVASLGGAPQNPVWYSQPQKESARRAAGRAGQEGLHRPRGHLARSATSGGSEQSRPFLTMPITRRRPSA